MCSKEDPPCCPATHLRARRVRKTGRQSWQSYAHGGDLSSQVRSGQCDTHAKDTSANPQLLSVYLRIIISWRPPGLRLFPSASAATTDSACTSLRRKTTELRKRPRMTLPKEGEALAEGEGLEAPGKSPRITSQPPQREFNDLLHANHHKLSPPSFTFCCYHACAGIFTFHVI